MRGIERISRKARESIYGTGAKEKENETAEQPGDFFAGVRAVCDGVRRALPVGSGQDQRAAPGGSGGFLVCPHLDRSGGNLHRGGRAQSVPGDGGHRRPGLYRGAHRPGQHPDPHPGHPPGNHRGRGHQPDPDVRALRLRRGDSHPGRGGQAAGHGIPELRGADLFQHGEAAEKAGRRADFHAAGGSRAPAPPSS